MAERIAVSNDHSCLDLAFAKRPLWVTNSLSNFLFPIPDANDSLSGNPPAEGFPRNYFKCNEGQVEATAVKRPPYLPVELAA